MLTYAQKLCRTACARSAADEEHALVVTAWFGPVVTV